MARTIKFIDFSCCVPAGSIKCNFISGSASFSFFGARNCQCCSTQDNLAGSLRVEYPQWCCPWTGEISCEVGVTSTLYTVPSGKVAKVVPRYISYKAEFEAFAGFAFTCGGWGNKLPSNNAYMFPPQSSDSKANRFCRCIYAEKATDAKIGYQVGIIHGGANRVAPGYGYLNLGEVLYDPDPTTSWCERANTQLESPDWCMIRGGLNNNGDNDCYYAAIACNGNCPIGLGWNCYSCWAQPCNASFCAVCMREAGLYNYIGTRCNIVIGPHKVEGEILAGPEANTFTHTGCLKNDNISRYDCCMCPAWVAYLGQEYMCAAACNNLIGNPSYDACNWTTYGRCNFSKLPAACEFKTDGLVSSVSGLQSFYLNAGESIGVNLKGYISYSTSATSLCCMMICMANCQWQIEACGNTITEGVYASYDLGAQLSYLVIEEDIEV